MKECGICGTFNLKENNYCTHCGCYIVEENICPFCGHKNQDSNIYCVKCNKPIHPISIENFDVLFNEYNLSLIENAQISEYEYKDILNKMFKKLDFITVSGKTPKEKILRIAGIFTPTIPKSSGLIHGEYKNTLIFYDDRLDDSLQIETIIHELAHYLLFELGLKMLCKILNVNESSSLKTFIDYFLTSSRIAGLNEYFAHTVENRYIPISYQNFSSFNDLVINADYDVEDNYEFILMVTGYAKDIIGYLDKYIDQKLRQSIKLQFKKDKPVVDRKVLFQFDEIEIDVLVRNLMFVGLMVNCFRYLYNNEEAREELEYIRNKFED